MVLYTVRKYYFFPSHVTFNLLLTSMSMPKKKNWRLDLVGASSCFGHPVFYVLGCLGFGNHHCKENFLSSLSVAVRPVTNLIAKHSWDHTVNSPFMIHASPMTKTIKWLFLSWCMCSCSLYNISMITGEIGY